MTQTIHHSTRPRYFFDAEFMEDGKTIELISIGIVCDDGREYYAANGGADLSKANDWVKANVVPQLPIGSSSTWKSRSQIAGDIKQFAPAVYEPEFWAYYADYDWVLFCQLFGRMIDLPAGYPQFCMDLKQYSKMIGSPTHPVQETGAHNALEDARWNKRLYDFLRAVET